MANKNTGNDGIGIGTGVLAGAAALAAGYYFYGSKDAKKHRKIVADWADDFKDKVVEEIATLQDAAEGPVMETIDKATEMYRVARGISKEDIGGAAQELKDNWQNLLKETQNKTKAEAGRTKSKVKQVAKKVKSKVKAATKKAKK